MENTATPRWDDVSLEAAATNPHRGSAPRIVSILPPRTTHRPPKFAWRHRLRCFCRFLCRLDVCWTFFFFFFLVCVAAITTAITQTKISRALLENLHDIHNLHITTIFEKIDQGTDRVFNMAAGFLALHSQSAFQLRSEETLSALCTILATYDPIISFRSLAVTSLQLKEAISCMHGDANLGSTRQLYGWYTEDSVISGVYLINNDTYNFIRPLQPVYGGWPTSEYNLSSTFENLAFNTAIFQQAAAYFNGSIAFIDYRTMWRSFTTIPHILYCTIPAGFLFRGLNLPPNINVTDYVDVRVDGSTIIAQLGTQAMTNITAAIFINASLHEKDPLIMSNNWGQASVNDTEILTTDDVGLVTYLPVSNVSDPLMRAALKHVDLKALQQEGHIKMVDFQYRGAPATVTAATLTTDRGLILPMVFVSSHTEIAMPYRRIMDICNGVTAVVILLFSVLFWYFIKSQLHDPLADIASLLLQSVKRGTRALFRTNHKHCVTLTEVQQLATAHNNAMRQLREIDTFIPEAVRHLLPTMQNRAKSNSISVFSPLSGDGIGGASPRTPSKLLLSLTSTVVYITISRAASTAVADRQTVLSTSMEGLPQRHRLAAIAASAARSVPMVNCGPFPSSAAVSAFVEKLHELCVLHHGTVHRLTPDSCILHFCKGVQDHMMEESLSSLFGGVAANAAAAQHSRRVTEGLVKKDARSAALFSLQLQAWWDRCKTWHLPDIRLLLDTSTFTFGHYRPSGCEQMIPMALGRDVQREVGAVPAIIGVRIAMTEETASCLRAGAINDATGEIEPGVRQLPVEALRTGRVGLDADVVVLFEVLPGPVLEDEAWQQYQQCCFDGFSFMVHGDYAAALRTFKDVMDISDLEPGLMPTSLRREAAATNVTGGAVSVQVERLMRECVQHILKRCTEGFHRRRQCPLGIDAVLGVSTAAVSTQQFERSANRSWSRPASTAAHPKPTDSINALRARYPTAPDRQVVELRVDKATLLRTVIATSFHWVEDNCGLVWQVVPRPYPCTSRAMWETRCRCLGSAGAIAILNFVAFCDVARPVANAIRDAPLGPMSDALRSAASVFGPTSQQEADLRALHAKCMELQHPNLLTPLGYSTSVEGGAALLWEYSSGGTLREVAKRYANINRGTVANFLHCVLEGLVYLHSLGIAHGAVHLDNILVGADGICRLHGHCTSLKLARRVFVVPQTCYVSPAMAAGALPTPACDMFCYGLLCIELLSGAKAWRWAVSDQGEPGGTDDELATLMAAAEQPFFDAVAAGRIVANIEALNYLAPTDDISKSGFAAWKDCLSLTASKRPSSLQLRTVTELYLSKVAR